MKTKTKNLVILLLIGLIFPLMINNNINFNDEYKSILNNPKHSGGYTEPYIHIDGSIPNNWSWTAGNYSWCNFKNGIYIIENVTIEASSSPTGIGILIENSKNEYFIIRNCTAYNSGSLTNDGGIKLVNVNNGTLINNNCSFNVRNGIILINYCDNNTISGNTINNNGLTGISVWNDSNNNTISGNTANFNQFGIFISDDCFSNKISRNTANYNDYGFSEQKDKYNIFSNNIANFNTDSGIYIYRSDFTTISDNTVNGNDIGIEMDGGGGIWEHNNITKNIIHNNSQGLYFYYNYENNLIYQNFFLKNGKHAEDDGTNNNWNSTTIGNYWDNHTGPDINNDGIVDIQYNISGSADSIDHLPIAEDGAPRITINSPSEGDAFSTVAPNFDVTITEDYLDTMWFTLDGGSNNSVFCKCVMIHQSAWDGMADGAITLTFYARDIPGYIGSAGVDIIKDTVAPIIIINSPAEGDRFGKNAPLFNISVTDVNLDVIWYSFDGGAHIYVITNNTVFNQTAWAELSEGDVTIMFYARDIAGNEAAEEVTVIKSVPSGLEPGVIITIVVVSIVGGVAVISVVYIFMKKRATP